MTLEIPPIRSGRINRPSLSSSVYQHMNPHFSRGFFANVFFRVACTNLMALLALQSWASDDVLKSQLDVPGELRKSDVPNAFRILYIGDSITKHGTNADIARRLGWRHEAGMAASEEAKDYASLVAAELQAEMPCCQVETYFHRLGGSGSVAQRLSAIGPAKAVEPHLVIVQLGEHEKEPDGLDRLKADYAALLTAFVDQPHPPRVIAVGPWAPRNEDGTSRYAGWPGRVEEAMREVCAHLDVPFVSVRDLAENPANSGWGEHPGVKWHPNDAGHAGYARKIMAAYHRLPQPGETAPLLTFTAGPLIREVPAGFFGVHDSRLFGVGRIKDHADAKSIAFIRDVGFEVLRGPDGTGSNYYLWREGRPLNSKDTRYPTHYGDHIVGMLERINLQPSFPPLTLEDIYKPAADLDLPYVFCLNVSSEPVESLVELVKTARRLTRHPVRVELGNELYALINNAAFPKVGDYVQRCAEIHRALKALDPTIQIAVVGVGADLEGRVMGDPAHALVNADVDMETTQKGRIELWNPSLRARPDIYDAVTVHISPPVNDMSAFTADSLMEYFFAFNSSSLGKLKAQATSFPGKQIWVTEWGFLPTGMLQKEGEERDRLQFLKTPGMAIARADRLLSMTTAPGVTITAYHDLLGGNGFGVGQHKPGSGGDIVWLPTAHTFHAVATVLKSHRHVYTLTTDTSVNRDIPVLYTRDVASVPPVTAYAYGDAEAPRQVVFINRTAEDRPVAYAGATLRPIWIYGGGDPLPDFKNHRGKWDALPTDILTPQPPTGAKASAQIVLPPYSMTICELAARAN